MYGHHGGKWWWDKLGVWDKHIYTTVYKIGSDNLLYSTGNSTNCSGDVNGKESEKRLIYVYIVGSLSCSAETSTVL